MVPANPPFPTTCSLPFHPDDGSQTSALMSDCAPGLSVRATRQNDPSFANGLWPPGGPPARPLGGVTEPAATVSASVTVPRRTASEVRLSHVAAEADDANPPQTPAKTTIRALRVDLISAECSPVLVR